MSPLIVRPATSVAVPMFMDPVVLLTERLSAGWIVERSIDPSGQSGIVVFAEEESETSPTYFIYENSGRIRLAELVGDEWQGSRMYQSYVAAASAIVAAIGR